MKQRNENLFSKKMDKVLYFVLNVNHFEIHIYCLLFYFEIHEREYSVTIVD